MPTLSPVRMERFQEFAAPLVESGRFATADDVLTAAMDALQREECDEQAKLAYLRQALEDGEGSGVYEGDVFADVRARLGLPPRS